MSTPYPTNTAVYKHKAEAVGIAYDIQQINAESYEGE